MIILFITKNIRFVYLLFIKLLFVGHLLFV